MLKNYNKTHFSVFVFIFYLTSCFVSAIKILKYILPLDKRQKQLIFTLCAIQIHVLRTYLYVYLLIYLHKKTYSRQF